MIRNKEANTYQGAYAFVEAIVVVRRLPDSPLTAKRSIDTLGSAIGRRLRNHVKLVSRRETYDVGVAGMCGVYIRFYNRSSTPLPYPYPLNLSLDCTQRSQGTSRSNYP